MRYREYWLRSTSLSRDICSALQRACHSSPRFDRTLWTGPVTVSSGSMAGDRRGIGVVVLVRQQRWRSGQYIERAFTSDCRFGDPERYALENLERP
jgi:hypothetical protein